MKKLRDFLMKSFFPASVLFFVVVLSLCPTGCRSTFEEGDDTTAFIPVNFEVPKLVDYRVLSPTRMEIDFSLDVTLFETSVTDTERGLTFGIAGSSYNEDHTGVIVDFSQQTEIGKDYTMDGTVNDSRGNSLKFSIPFKGFNDEPASVCISEVRNYYGQPTRADNPDRMHLTEYVELYVKESGNLSGLKIYYASHAETKAFVLPSVRVNKGEYVLCHMRTPKDEPGVVSELDDDLRASTHYGSCDARDLWSECTTKTFESDDIVVVENSFTGKIIDAFLYAKSNDPWPAKYNDILAKVAASGVWNGGTGIESAYKLTSNSSVKSVIRRDFDSENNAGNWDFLPSTGGY